jgi:hypothetical protein
MAYKRPTTRESDDEHVPLLLRPLGLAFVALIFFLLVFTVLLWRDGRFDGFWSGKGAILSSAPRDWMMGGKDKGKALDLAPPSSAATVFDADKDRFEAAPPPREEAATAPQE